MHVADKDSYCGWLSRLLCGFLMLALMQASTAVAQKGPTTVTQIGDRKVALVVPEGHCVLDRSQTADKALLAFVEGLIAGQNQLHLLTTNCAELSDWRTGKRPTLGEYTQVQSRIQLNGRDFAGQERPVIKALCDEAKKNGASHLNTAEAEVVKRLAAAQDKAKLENVALLGVLDEDEHGCYLGMVLKIQVDGPGKTQLCVFATTILNGKLAYLYRYAETIDSATVARLLAAQKASAKDHVDANLGHGQKN